MTLPGILRSCLTLRSGVNIDTGKICPFRVPPTKPHGARSLGTNADRQRANSKDEDPTGLLNEGFRYRDLETGTFITRDPAGFVNGPNFYASVQQNPWTKFDPHGLRDDLLFYEVGAGGSLSGYPTDLKPQAGSLGMGYQRKSDPSISTAHADMMNFEQGDIFAYNGHGGNIKGAGSTIAVGGKAPPGEMSVTYNVPGWFGASEVKGTGYKISDLTRDVGGGKKGVPAAVIITGCEVTAKDLKALNAAEVSLVIAAGGHGDSRFAGEQMKAILDTLGKGKSVDDALNAANKLVDKENRTGAAGMYGSHRDHYEASFGNGIDGKSTLSDIQKANEAVNKTRASKSDNDTKIER
jgi:RHS repeat-associated protein